ncbi:MAG: glycosyltransferase family 2 protein [Solirubrobacterales bacterium]|nr:hypothetical protein [Solirubrobacterales bacterium]
MEAPLRVVVSILTYNRPGELRALLDDLEREARRVAGDVAVRIYDDCSERYGSIAGLAAQRGYTYVRASHNHGKAEHWRWVGRELADLRDVPADWYVFLPDDCRLVSGFFPRALALWERLDEPTALTLVAQAERLGPCWTGMRPRHGDGWCEVGWIDGLHLCRRELLELLEFSVGEPPGRSAARRDGLRGSGVGQQLSTRALRRGARLYRVDESLVELVPVPSQMNPRARARHPLLSIRLAAEVSHD